MGYLIKPIDVMHFGTGKSSTAIDSHIISSNFIPSIFTLAGAFRNAIFEKRNISLDDVINYVRNDSKDDKTLNNLINNLEVIGPFIHEEDKLFFQIPKDIIKKKNKFISSDFLMLKKIKVKFDKLIDLEYLPWFYTKERLDDFDERFINLDGLKRYLLAEEIENNSFKKTKDFFTKITRPGIKINKEKKRAEEHHLYFEEYVTFINNGISFYLELNSEYENDIGNKIIIPLGGERRWFVGEKIDFNLRKKLLEIKDEIKKEILKKGIFKLLFLTPAIFKNGWKIEINGLKILGCMIDRYLNIGGWDMARIIPKANKRYIQSGSVYICKAERDKIEDIFERFYLNESLTDDYAGLGFGKTIIGLTNLKEEWYG